MEANAKVGRRIVQKVMRAVAGGGKPSQGSSFKTAGYPNLVGQCPGKIPQYEGTELANELEGRKQRGSKAQDLPQLHQHSQCLGILGKDKDLEMRVDPRRHGYGDCHNQLLIQYHILVPEIKVGGHQRDPKTPHP